MTGHLRLIGVAGAMLSASLVARAQVYPRPAFDVVSVKPNTSKPGRSASGFQPGGRYSATNMPLRHVIHEAYRVQDFQLEGGPRWIPTQGFDIEAKAAQDAPRALLEVMLQTMLEDRFKLVIRRETRVMQALALTATSAAGRRLQPAVPTCGDAPEEFPNHMTQFASSTCRERITNGFAKATVTMPQLAAVLTPLLGRLVSDRTGLTGSFAIQLTWAPDENKKGKGDGLPSDRPSLSSALQEQLGLKLEAERRSVDILVIERAEPPTEN